MSDNSPSSDSGQEENKDLFISLGDQYWKSCPEEQKLTAATSSFSFVTNAEGETVYVARIRTPMPLLSYLAEDLQWDMALSCCEWKEEADTDVRKDLEQCYRMVHNARTPKTKKTKKEAEEPQNNLINRTPAIQDSILGCETERDKILNRQRGIRAGRPEETQGKINNFVSGRWAPIVKNDQQGTCCNARPAGSYVDSKEKIFQQTDSPASTTTGTSCT